MKIFVSPEDDKTIFLNALKKFANWVIIYIVVFLIVVLSHKWFGAPYGLERAYPWRKIYQKLPDLAELAMFYTVIMFFAKKMDSKYKNK